MNVMSQPLCARAAMPCAHALTSAAASVAVGVSAASTATATGSSSVIVVPPFVALVVSFAFRVVRALKAAPGEARGAVRAGVAAAQFAGVGRAVPLVLAQLVVGVEDAGEPAQAGPARPVMQGDQFRRQRLGGPR